MYLLVERVKKRYSGRKKRWEEWLEIIRPYYSASQRGWPAIELELVLWMYLLQVWFNLSDPGTEDAIYDSYAMRISVRHSNMP